MPYMQVVYIILMAQYMLGIVFTGFHGLFRRPRFSVHLETAIYGGFFGGLVLRLVSFYGFYTTESVLFADDGPVWFQMCSNFGCTIFGMSVLGLLWLWVRFLRMVLQQEGALRSFVVLSLVMSAVFDLTLVGAYFTYFVSPYSQDTVGDIAWITTVVGLVFQSVGILLLGIRLSVVLGLQVDALKWRVTWISYFASVCYIMRVAAILCCYFIVDKNTLPEAIAYYCNYTFDILPLGLLIRVLAVVKAPEDVMDGLINSRERAKSPLNSPTRWSRSQYDEPSARD